jgi:hypothetical protein
MLHPDNRQDLAQKLPVRSNEHFFPRSNLDSNPSRIKIGKLERTRKVVGRGRISWPLKEALYSVDGERAAHR